MSFIAHSLYNGADGVYIAGCKLNECNYITHGNFYALNVTLLFKKLLETIGINSHRIRMEFLSSSDAQHFVESVNDFTERIRKLGPLGENENIDSDELKIRIYHLITLIPYLKIVFKNKLSLKVTNPAQWDEIFTTGEVSEVLKNAPSYFIDPEKCAACTLCAQRCPVEAIDGGKNKIHIINQEKCIKCGNCYAVCPTKFSAVKKIIGQMVPPPIPEEKRLIKR